VKRTIRQIVAGYAIGDAISNEAEHFSRIFSEWGHRAPIYCEQRSVAEHMRGHIRDLTQLQAESGPDDIILLHLSMGSPANELFPRLPGRKVILYHNVTPPDFFRGINQQICNTLQRGQDQVRALAGTAEIVLADSAYNASELATMGYGRVDVLPLVLDYSQYEPSRADRRAHGHGHTHPTILFVGRCVPNKRIEELIDCFAYYRRAYAPEARLIHVGSFYGTERYNQLLKAYVRDNGIEGVELRGAVSQKNLNAAYREATLFLCMSEHEGFCIPLIEAMVHQLPVVAHASAAIPETMDGAGVLLHERSPALAAATVHQIHEDAALRNAILDGQARRLERFKSRDLASELRSHLNPLLG
jgi:glycosyltransferase involved in cell wall biosynthesis